MPCAIHVPSTFACSHGSPLHGTNLSGARHPGCLKHMSRGSDFPDVGQTLTPADLADSVASTSAGSPAGNSYPQSGAAPPLIGVRNVGLLRIEDRLVRIAVPIVFGRNRRDFGDRPAGQPRYQVTVTSANWQGLTVTHSRLVARPRYIPR